MKDAHPHVVLAVVDRTDDDTVIWHVQTDPAATSILSGAWIVNNDNDRGLLTDTVIITDPAQLDALANTIRADVAALRHTARAAKKANPALTLPRFDDPPNPDPAALAQTFHGEPRARTAWSIAVSLAEMVDYWHTLESARKVRRYLVDAYGSDVRALPVAKAVGA